MVLATANGAGYRFGTSDQAFYVPAVVHALDPAAFPRDGTLLDAQAGLMTVDQGLATVVRLTGAPLDAVFLAAYLVTLALMWAAVILIGERLYASRWTTLALGAALTFRHRIPRTSANSFEPYFNPRMLAFAIGLLAVAALVRRRRWEAIVLIALAAVVHITTALWFAVLVGAALAILDPRIRRTAWIAAGAAAAGGAWAVTVGPLRGRLIVMDPIWRQAVATKDSLFPNEWPPLAWAANLALLAIVWLAWRARVRQRLADDSERALAWGSTALVGMFLLTLPLVAAGFAVPVQFQISRVFWLVDLVATILVVGALAGSGPRTARLLAIVLIAASAGRGAYVMVVEHPERALVRVSIPPSPWLDAMHWIGRQPGDAHVLADPGHAWKYGTSVRVAAGHDVFLEEVKDSAIAIYSHDVAARVVERTRALGDFATMTADRALALARRYDLDYLVTDATLPLPVAYRNRQFTIYRLLPRHAGMPARATGRKPG